MENNTRHYKSKLFLRSIKREEAGNNVHNYDTVRVLPQVIMTVFLELTDKQEKAIKELRERLFGEMSIEMYEDDYMFHRFLKARDYNVDDAEYMLRNHLAWRREFNVDTILQDYTSKEVLVKHFPGNYIGLDKAGCPVKYFQIGNLDPKGIRRGCKFLPDIVKHVIRFMEEEMEIVKQQNEKLGKPITGSMYIADLKHLSFSTATDKKMIDHAIYLTKMYQDNYPERLKAVYVINVSPYFSLVYNIIKCFVADSILKKITFYSNEDYKRDLRELVDPDVLPAFLGGDRTDPDGDPYCHSFMNFTGPVPAKYFVQKNSRCLAKQEGVKRLLVRRVSISEIELQVSEPHSVIQWEFETRSRDIGFGLFFRDQEGRMAELVALMRMDTDDFSETGIHKCERTGTYVIVFDNSYSWLRSKEIYYRVVVKTPKDYEDTLKNID